MHNYDITIKGTTPTYTLALPKSVDMTKATNVYVTFAKPTYEVIVQKESADLVIEAHTIDVFLTQEETLRFPLGEVYMQLNFTYDEGDVIKRASSQIIKIKSARNLINEVIE